MNGVVVFDYDDTLVQSRVRIIEVLQKLYVESFDNTHSTFLNENLPMSLDKLYEYLIDSKIEDESYEDFTKKYYSEEPDRTEPLDWTLPILRELHLRRYGIIICSSNKYDIIERNLIRLELRQYFDYIITADSKHLPPNLIFQKSDSNLIPLITSLIGNKDFRAVLIGDSFSDHILAHNSRIPFIHVDQLKEVSLQEQIKTIEDKIVAEASNLLVNQYKALRDEIILMQTINERVYNSTIISIGVFWTTLLALIFKENLTYFPSFVFSIPCLYALTSLSTYITNDLRISNISSFIGIYYRNYFPRELNWENRIGDFSRSLDKLNSHINLSSAFSTVSLYQILIFGALFLSIAVSVKFGFKNYWHLDSIADSTFTIFVDSCLIIIYTKIIKRKTKYSDGREHFNNVWESIK